MSGVLGQLAVGVGALIFIIALALALLNGVPVLVAILRAAVAMCLGTMITAIFFRYFTGILYRFVSDRLKEQAPQAPPTADKTAPGKPAGPEQKLK